MNPCGIRQNMIRLVMVFTPPGVDFAAALWYHGSRIFSISFPFHVCVPIFINIILQFDNDKDDGKIEKVGNMSCPEVYPRHIIKTENEGKTIELCCKSIFFPFLYTRRKPSVYCYRSLLQSVRHHILGIFWKYFTNGPDDLYVFLHSAFI